MILDESFHPAWIQSHRQLAGYEKINPPLVEKMIFALALVESLAATGLDFVFKGGTSLILLMPAAGRFSIDIDIITEADRKEIESILNKICTSKPFLSFKLTAFAPNTTGIPYNKGKELEIIKQLFDLGRLFHEIKNMEEVSASFDKTVEKEIIYREGTYTRNDVLDDIIQTGLLIARRDKNKGEPHISNFRELQRGLLQFKPYQMTFFSG